MNRSATPAILVVAGSDSGGGAGLQRDLSILTPLPLRTMCAVTAVTAQTDSAVRDVHAVPPDVLRAQLEAACDSAPIAAVKIGMLASRAQTIALAETLRARCAGVPIVLDPVMAASCGDPLLDADALDAVHAHLLPLLTLITPNLHEAALLTGSAAAHDEQARIVQARRILAAGPTAVLLKGGHAQGREATDLLLCGDDASPRWYRTPRVDATLRGSGCALSTAVAAAMAMGLSLDTAVSNAKRRVHALFTQVRASAPHADPAS